MLTRDQPARKSSACGASLLDRILNPTNLASAWEMVARNAGMPGVDDVSVARFARQWEGALVDLAAEVRGNSYRPDPLRVQFIPKFGGGWRRISVPTVRDRVLQRATLQVLLPRFDRKFLFCSFGYRPKRCVGHAVAALLRYRDRGRRWVLEADIDDCFGSLDQSLLLGFAGSEITDARVLGLWQAWLAIGASPAGSGVGIALGMPISPLWANIYLHEMDRALVNDRWPLVRYADDFVVPVCSSVEGEAALARVVEVLAGLRLRLEPTKTRVTSFAEGFEFLGVRFESDSYAFIHRSKRITVEGGFQGLWSHRIGWDY